ncbi:MAG: protein jag [Chloroflexi bacterium]|nr:protein jag [Chloroflexota bacterium]
MADPKTSIEIISPSIEEAVSRGAAELGVPEDAVEVEVLDEGKKGFLGLGNRQARVRMTIRDDFEGQPIPADRSGAVQPEGEEDEVLVVTRETVGELLQRMGVEAELSAYWGEKDENSRLVPLHVDIHGSDLSILIGRRGETLSALQYITRLIVGKELQRPVGVVVDVEGYRGRREQQLRQLARRMASQAVERGKTMTLEPMPPNERRIIHIELRDHAQVYTESVGEGDRRKLTIIVRS